VIEVRSASEAGSFENFCRSLQTHIPAAKLVPGGVSVDYKTLDNVSMRFAFPDGRVLNGTNVDLGKTKLFDGPFLESEVGSGRLTMRYKGMTRILDFTTGKTTE
jgi:hypothetical protein